MLTLVNILIIFFIVLILYQIILASNIIEANLQGSDSFTPLVEGLETQYKPYDINNPNNALILAQQNAGNISYLKERIDSVQGMNKLVQDLSGNVLILQEQVNGLVQAQKEYANQLTGGVAPEITGATDEEGTNTDNLITE